MTIKGKNLLFRVIIAMVFCPAVLYALYSGGIPLLVFLLVVVFGLLTEFGTLPAVDLNALQEGVLVAAGLLIPVFAWLESPLSSGVWLPVFCAVWFLLELTRKRITGCLERSAKGVFAIMLFSQLPSLAFDLNRAEPLYAVLPIALVWVADTFAYFAGSTFKGPKITPVLSPHKTWSGFIGEIVGAAAVGLAFRLIWPSVFSWGIMIFAIPAGVIAVAGDLFESKAKREMNIKDSSPAIPGHGGIWDRFDSWLFVQLWAWVYYIVLR